MTSRTFIAADPAGKIHKRTSVSRTYTHTVVRWVRPVTEADKARKVKSALCASAGLWAYYNRSVNTPCQTIWEEQRRAETQEWLKKFPTDEAYLASVRAKTEAQANEWQERVGNGYWVNEGWCGRLDLAQKLASRVDGVVLPATIKQKKEAV